MSRNNKWLLNCNTDSVSVVHVTQTDKFLSGHTLNGEKLFRA